MESHWASFELRLDPIFHKRLNLTCRMARKNLNQHSLNRLCTAAFRSRCQLNRKRGSRRPVSGRKTQAPKQTSGRERLSRPDLALPRNVTFSSAISRGASMSPCSVQPDWSAQHSVTKILPSTVPRTFSDLVLISPRMRACSPIVSVPVESIVPSTSPSMSSSFRNLTEPLIETPRERIAPDCVGMNVLLDGPGTTDGSG